MEGVVVPKENAFYETLDGDRIPFIPGYYEQVTSSYPFGITDTKKWIETRRASQNSSQYPKTEGFLMNKIITTTTLFSWLRQVGIERDPNRSLLDICTGPAVLPRLFKAYGWAAEAIGVDIIDRQHDFSDEAISKALESLRGAFGARPDNVLKAIESKFGTVWRDQMGMADLPLTDILRKPDHSVGMDQYDVGDFSHFPNDKKFDIITLAAGLEYFHIEEFFARVSSLLAPGGVFFTFNDYFYQIRGASMHLPAHAPWMHCMLTRDEYYRYVRIWHSDISDDIGLLYYFPSTHYTIEDLKACAARNGLSLIGYRRGLDTKNVISGWGFLRDVVLPRAKKLNPSVEIDDFFTHYYSIAFRKV